RHDHVVALAVELDDLELHLLALVGRGVLHRAQVDERAREERADALDHDGQAALHLAGDDALDLLPALERLLELEPGGHALRLVAREPRRAVAVLERLDGDADEVARLHLHLSGVVAEFVHRNDAFGLEPGVHHDEVVVDADDLRGDDLADAHLLAVQALLEERRKGLAGRLGGFLGRRSWRNAGHKNLLSRGLSGAAGCVGKRRGALLYAWPTCLSRQSRRTCSTTASMPSAVESTTTESAAGTRGATGRLASRASRSCKSRERARRLASIPFSFNCL